MEDVGLLGLVIAALFGFLAATFSEPLRDQIYGARLKLHFDEGPACISRTTEQGANGDMIRSRQAIYLRIEVKNRRKRIAKGCLAYLTNVEFKDGNGQFEPTQYVDSIQLAWSCRGENAFSPIDIPYGVSQFVDVISTNEETPNSVAPRLQFLPNRYAGMFERIGQTRLTIQVAGDRVTPKSIKVVVDWKGSWDTFHASSSG